MKRQSSTGQKAAAAAVLILTALSAAYCVGEPSEQIVPSQPLPSRGAELTAPTASPSQSPALPELEEHGYYQDPLVNQGPLPNRQAPRRAWRKDTAERKYSQESADEVVEAILGSIVTQEMSDIQKCAEVYYYIKGCISCNGASVRSSWREAAYWGFTTGRGDEYTFYACSRALLSGLGFQVREVRREGGDLEEPHSWCLVNFGEGWYHFDPCPHLKSDPEFICCLSIDQQLMNFDAGAQRDYYAFDPDAYPERVGGRADPAYLEPMPRREEEEERPDPVPTPSPSATPEPSVSSTPTPATEDSESPRPSPTAQASPSPSAVPSASAPPSPAPTLSAVPSSTPVPTPEPPAPSAAEPTPSPAPEPTPEPSPPPAATPVPEEPLLPPDV